MIQTTSIRLCDTPGGPRAALIRLAVAGGLFATACSGELRPSGELQLPPAQRGAVPMPPGAMQAAGSPAPSAGAPAASTDAIAGPAAADMPPIAPGSGLVAGAGGQTTEPETEAGEPGTDGVDPLVEASCPGGFEPVEGNNTDFPTQDSGMRQFVVSLPEDMSTPRPVMVVLTGTVESTVQSMTTNSRLSADLLPRGWVLLGPVRQCSTGPADGSQSCATAGLDGWNWRPWNEGAANSAAGMRWWSDEGPDARFMKSMVRCVATKWSLDAKRLFVVGISSGGTMTNRLLTFQSDFWAGGIPESGEWYVQGGNSAVAQMPEAIIPGRCCPLPALPEKLGPLFVITSWGGPRDTWMGLSDYRPTTQAGSNYFSAQPDVIHVACSGTHGHRWQPVEGFNVWAADQLYAHPKGSTRTPMNSVSYLLPSPPPAPYACVAGRYTDHY